MNADGLAHGCTGKGNDQVRFDVTIGALAPDLKLLTPAREWGMSREETIAYGEKYGIVPPVSKKNPYSIDLNLLGRSIEAGPLEDPFEMPSEEVFGITSSIANSPNEPEIIDILFENGNPVAIDGERMEPVNLIKKANSLAGKHGFGRLDIIEDRVVGIKSREIYETPGLLLLIKAHKEMESLTLPADLLNTKASLERQWANLVYQGFWFSPLKEALDGFMNHSQKQVNGNVKIRLFKGNADVIGRKSKNNSLYITDMSTYGREDRFNHKSAEGFIYVWGLPSRIWSWINK